MFAQGQSGARRSLAEDASGCVPEASVKSSSQRQTGASKAYSFVVGLSSCFRGKVRMSFPVKKGTLQVHPCARKLVR